MLKKYVLFPGYVRSRNDGQYHRVGVGALCRLYGVRLQDCIIADALGLWRHGRNPWVLPKLLELRPRDDGIYCLEREHIEQGVREEIGT